MADKLTKEQRHRCMSRIRGRDTGPEILVRKGLHARGFRFRLQDRRLPGRPDIVLPRWGVVVMVNGCFWHGHKGCRYATRPKTNSVFWQTKIVRNIHRDEVTAAHLEALGWHVATVWECELRTHEAAEARLDALDAEIREVAALKSMEASATRISRLSARREKEAVKARLALLQSEIDALYPIPRRIKKEAEGE